MQDLPPGFQLDSGPAPAPSRAPGVIRGAPSQAERRAEEDQRLEREKFARQQAVEEERLNLARNAETRASTQAQQGGVEQGKAASFLRRAINAETSFRKLGEVAPRSYPGQIFKDAAPDAANLLSDATRQQADQAEREFIASILRYDSGAAIPDNEFISNAKIYFPRPGDTPEVLRQKAESRRVAIEGLYSAAGPAGAQIELPNFADPAPLSQEPTAADQAPLGVRLGADGAPDDAFNRVEYLQQRFGIDPGNESRLVGFFNANIGNPNVTPDMVARWYLDSGVSRDEASLPPRAELERIAGEFQKGQRGTAVGIDTSDAEKAYVRGLDTIIQRAGFTPEDQGDTFVNSARQGAAFEGYDEIVGIGNAIAEGLQGNDPFAGYRTGRDVTRRITERGDEANFYTGLAGRVAGAIPTGVVGSAGRINSLGSAARVGAVEGGITGFNSGDGFQNSALRAAAAAPIGALVSTGFQAGGNALGAAARRGRVPVDPARVDDVIQAGARRDVTVRRPDVDPNIRQQRATVQQSEGGRAAIAAADAEDIAQIETALIRDLGGRAGAVRTEVASNVQTGVKASRDGLRNKAKVEYRAAAAEAGNVTAPPTNAVAAIDQQIAELTQNGANLNAGRIKFLQDLKADMTQGGGLSINGLRAQRTELRKNLENAGIYTGDFERRIGLVLTEASKDIDGALAAFPRAQARFREGDKLWAQQADFGKKVGNLLLGKDGNLAPGQAADRLMGWAKKDPARLNRLLSEADDATKEEVRALVVSQLGRGANGNFSLAALLTQTGGGRGGALSPPAVRALFGDDGVKALADLRILSQAKVDAASATNRSNTGGIVQKAKSGLRRLVLGGFGFTAAMDAGGGAGLATLAAGGATLGGEIVDRLGRERAIRLLLNPDFTGWLRRLPETSNPDAINRSFAGLRSTAARSPVMTADIQAFERMLVEAVNDNGTRLAAEPQGADQQGRGQ